ncbi:EXS family-domain-containing protein [Haematococcus lacustris]
MTIASSHWHDRKALLTRVQPHAVLLWCLGCSLLVAKSLPQLHRTAHHILYLHFQPMLPPLTLLWLWGAAVRRFTSLGIDYESCFIAKDRRYLLPGHDIQKVALVLLGITLSWCALYCAACLAHWYSLAEFVPLMLYTSLAAAILLPLPIFFHATRQYFVATWMRVMLPLDEVTWADFLLADMLCSLSKSSADFAQSMCHMATGRVMKELASPRHQDSELCRPVAPLLLLGLTYPYLVRFAQCLRVYSATRNTAQLFNAAKYCSSLPTLLLGAWAHEAHATGQGFSLHRAWLLASALNSAFSFYWDVEQDWDMPWLWAGLGPGRWRAPPPLVGPLDGLGHSRSFTAWRWLLPGLKPDALYRPRLWYAWALATNLVLRLAWLHRLILRLDLSPAFSLALGLAEAWRRYQWSFIRIETELRKLATKHGSSSLLPPAQPPAPVTPAAGSASVRCLLYQSSLTGPSCGSGGMGWVGRKRQG